MGESQKISELIEQLAMQAIMVEPDDVITLGAILENLEAIEKAGGDGGPQSFKEIGQALRKLVEKIIIQDFSNPAEGCQLLRQGVGVLQHKLSPPSRSSLDEEENFLKKMAPLVDVPLPAAPEKKEQSPPTMEETVDPNKDLDIYRDFITEGMEHLSAIELNIINLEQDPENKGTLNAIFRPFHTIKGVAGFLNLQEIQKFSHAMESLLDEARNLRLAINPEFIDFILDAVDVLKGAITDLKNNLDCGQVQHAPLEMDTYLEKVASFQPGGSKTSSAAAPKEKPKKVDAKALRLGEILTAKGVISETDVRDALREQVASPPGIKIGEILGKVLGTSSRISILLTTLLGACEHAPYPLER